MLFLLLSLLSCINLHSSPLFFLLSFGFSLVSCSSLWSFSYASQTTIQCSFWLKFSERWQCKKKFKISTLHESWSPQWQQFRAQDLFPGYRRSICWPGLRWMARQDTVTGLNMGLAWQPPQLAHCGDLETGPATASPCGGCLPSQCHWTSP